MSNQNIKGAVFAILNDHGTYDLYTPDGHLIKGLNEVIRITQRANDIDRILYTGLVNVVRDKEEMNKIINP